VKLQAAGAHLGSGKTFVDLATEGVNTARLELLKPLLRRAVAERVAVALAFDESPATVAGKSKPLIMVHIYACFMKQPLTFEMSTFERAPTGQEVVDKLQEMLTADGWLSVDEYKRHVRIAAGD
jgi:hypothetical protein